MKNSLLTIIMVFFFTNFAGASNFNTFKGVEEVKSSKSFRVNPTSMGQAQNQPNQDNNQGSQQQFRFYEIYLFVDAKKNHDIGNLNNKRSIEIGLVFGGGIQSDISQAGIKAVGELRGLAQEFCKSKILSMGGSRGDIVIEHVNMKPVHTNNNNVKVLATGNAYCYY